MEDSQIVVLYRQRSEKALSETRSKYGKYCIYIANNILGCEEDAEECVNEALYAVWNSIPPAEPENLKTYIGKLTREISITRRRQNCAAKRYGGEFPLTLEEIEEVIPDDSSDPEADAEALSGAISDFLRTLPESARNIFIRRYWFGDRVKDICERYSFGESKVKVTLKRSREKLAEYLKKEGFII